MGELIKGENGSFSSEEELKSHTERKILDLCPRLPISTRILYDCGVKTE